MKFSMTHNVFKNTKPEIFDEESAPDWLRFGGKQGSTMDNRWFWNDYVMKLKVGQKNRN